MGEFVLLLDKDPDELINVALDVTERASTGGSGLKIKKKTLKGIVLPKYSSVDINDQKDWDFAKILYKKMKT